MAAYQTTTWHSEHVWEEHWQEAFPTTPVVVPAAFAQWALRTHRLAGSKGLGQPVINVENQLILLWYASEGQWWAMRLGASA